MLHDETRKFVHELANQMFVIDASVSRALKLAEKKLPESDEEVMRLKKAEEYIKKSITTITNLRSHIHLEIKEYQESQLVK